MEAGGVHRRLLVPAPGGTFRFPIDNDRLELTSPERQNLMVRGERASRIDYGWLHRGEWLPIPPELLRGDSSRSVGQVLVRAEVPGRIHRLVAYPSSKSTLEFDFRRDGSPIGFWLSTAVNRWPARLLKSSTRRLPLRR